MFFHPLRSYPGPFLRKITYLPRWYDQWQGNEATAPLSLHLKYGPVLRISPNELSFIEAEAWNDIYGFRTGSKAGKLNNPKDPNFYTAAPGGAEDIIVSTDENHSRFRKAFSNGFSDRGLRGQEPLFREHRNKLVTALEKVAEAGQAVDIAEWYNFLTFDVMSDLTFAEPLGLLDKLEHSPYVNFLFDGARLNTVLKGLREYPTLNALVWWATPQSIKQMGLDYFDFSAKRVDLRLERGTTKPDLWSTVTDKLSLKEMHANSLRFMAAGTETTATTLAGVTWHLLKSPEKMAKLQEELRAAFPTEEDITIEQLQRQPYLNACIEETLRLYPPVPSALVRVAANSGEIAGHFVPQGTKVAIPMWAAYHHPGNFVDPDAFVPERWLPEHDPKYDADQKDVFHPFSFGKRACIGKK